MSQSLQEGMNFHAFTRKIRTLLRDRYVNGKPQYKKGVYIISEYKDRSHYKVGMSRNSYMRLRRQYNICYSQLTKFRLHYFIEVDTTGLNRADEKMKLQTMEALVLSKMQLDADENPILTTYKSAEWVVTVDKRQTREMLLAVLNDSNVWKRIYSFNNNHYHCIDRVRLGQQGTLTLRALDVPNRRDIPCSSERSKHDRELNFKIDEKKEIRKLAEARQRRLEKRGFRFKKSIVIDSENEIDNVPTVSGQLIQFNLEHPTVSGSIDDYLDRTVNMHFNRPTRQRRRPARFRN